MRFVGDLVSAQHAQPLDEFLAHVDVDEMEQQGLQRRLDIDTGHRGGDARELRLGVPLDRAGEAAHDVVVGARQHPPVLQRALIQPLQHHLQQRQTLRRLQ